VQVGAPGPSALYIPTTKTSLSRGLRLRRDRQGHNGVLRRIRVFYDAFSQDMFLGHFRTNCTFCPGPAFTGVGIAPITFFSATPGPITAGSPVYVNGFPVE